MNQKQHPGSSANCPRPVWSRRNPFRHSPEFEGRCPGFKSRRPESKTFRPDFGKYSPGFESSSPDYLDGSPDFFPSCPEFVNGCPRFFWVCPDFLSLPPNLKAVPPIFFGSTLIYKSLETGTLARFQSSKPEKLPKDGGLPSPADSSGESAEHALDLAFEITRQIQN
ncbi:MAG TPA: hypothetical protein VGH42_04830 [Verrucomicrobiae bacterium]|jgi:hypothetical protein